MRHIAVLRTPTMIVTFPNTVLITERQPPVIYPDNDGNRHHAEPLTRRKDLRVLQSDRESRTILQFESLQTIGMLGTDRTVVPMFILQPKWLSKGKVIFMI